MFDTEAEEVLNVSDGTEWFGLTGGKVRLGAHTGEISGE